MSDRRFRLAFAGDRDIAVDALRVLLDAGDAPLALLLPDDGRGSHDAALVAECAAAGLTPPVIRASQLHDPASVEHLRSLELDYLVCVHFPYMIRRAVLDTASCGVLNLHPSYLPFNRGWHTPSWAILDGTPAGASLHYMAESLDSGDVVCQQQIAVDPADTAHTLYLRLKALERDVFVEGWSRLRDGRSCRQPQPHELATQHRRQSLFDPAVQRIDLQESVPAGDLLRRLRALTTSRLDEAAYFLDGDRRYRVQVTITPDPGVATDPSLELSL